jgi:hypothetical protein
LGQTTVPTGPHTCQLSLSNAAILQHPPGRILLTESEVVGGMSPDILAVCGSGVGDSSARRTTMHSIRKISLHLHLWIAAPAAVALSIGTWSITPAPANAGVVIGVGIPFAGLYAQYPYYPYPPPIYYPYYPPPAPAYQPPSRYTPQPTHTPQASRSGGNIARQLNQQELNRLQATPAYPPPPPYYPPPSRY